MSAAKSTSDQIRERMVQSSWSLYLGSAAIGLGRTAVGFPLEHPLDSIKTEWQAKPSMPHELAIVKDIYKRKGVFQGFYAGSLPNLTRCLLKNTYRYPLMVGLPNFYKEILPQSIQNDKKILKLLTGISIGGIEAGLLCPIERVKVHFMTQR